MSKKILCISMLLMFIACNGEKASSKSQPTQGLPELHLSLHKLDYNAQQVSLELVVTNVGKHLLAIPHVSEERLKQSIVWGGWGFFIKSQDNQLFTLDKRRPSLFKKSDLIKLEPGESFTEMFNIADAVLENFTMEDDIKSSLTLINAHGEYEVTVHLSLDDDNISFWLRKTLWKGEIKSNTITFSINRENQSQLASDENQQNATK